MKRGKKRTTHELHLHSCSMENEPLTTMTLRALHSEPLRDPVVRSMVEATAYAIAERQGVEVTQVYCENDRILITVKAGRLVAIGLATELRRVTTTWYTRKFDAETLWGEPRSKSHDDFENDGYGDPDFWKKQ